MKQIFFLFTVIALFAACTDNDGEAQPVNTEETTRKPDSTLVPSTVLPAKLDAFASIPDTIDGCGDYYAAESDSAVKGKYIFLSNLQEFAIIRVNGKEIYLTKNESLSREVSPDHFISVFEGNGYKATLEAKIAEQYDEGGFYKGTLEIAAGNEKMVVRVHGESGC